LSNEYVLDIIGALHQTESKKQINVDIKQLEKVINMLRLTGTFAKGDTKKELNAYIKSLQSQLAHIKLAAKIDSRNLKSEVDKVLRNVSFKDIDAFNIDENKAKLKIRKVIADAKAYVEKTPITVNIESKKAKLGNDLTTYLNRNTKINESSVLLEEAEKVRELINVINDKKTLREATDAFQLYKSEVSATGFNTKSTTDKIKGMLGHVSKVSSALGIASMAVNNFARSLKALKSNDTILVEISKTSEMTKKQLFDKLYIEYINLPKKERAYKIMEEMLPYFDSIEELKWYVDLGMERKKRNLTARRVRMVRKANLAGFNYFVTFTYDDKKHTEETFKKKLKNKLSLLAYRQGWKYMGVWERSPEKKRLHFHGLFNVPDGTMPGQMETIRDYSKPNHKMQDSLQCTYFTERFGRNDFKELNPSLLGESLAYIMKYIEKTGEKIVYSKGLYQFFMSDIMEEDIVTTIGQEDKKLLLFDDFSCWNEGQYIGKVSNKAIAEMKKCN